MMFILLNYNFFLKQTGIHAPFLLYFKKAKDSMKKLIRIFFEHIVSTIQNPSYTTIKNDLRQSRFHVIIANRTFHDQYRHPRRLIILCALNVLSECLVSGIKCPDILRFNTDNGINIPIQGSHSTTTDHYTTKEIVHQIVKPSPVFFRDNYFQAINYQQPLSAN